MGARVLMGDARRFLPEEIAALYTIAGVVPRDIEGQENLSILQDGVYIGYIRRDATLEEVQRALKDLLHLTRYRHP